MKKKKSKHTLLTIISLEVFVVLGGLIFILVKLSDKIYQDDSNEKPVVIKYVEETETEDGICVPEPDIDEQLLTINEYSRPGTKIDCLDYIVIHYLANPKTTAQENHDYFESLKDLKNVSMSANYVIGLDGEIIHCVPDDEIAYASNDYNKMSISIENCHMDTTGKLNAATYESLVKLVAYLSEKYDIDRDHIIRHFDVTGKECPKYYVDHPDKWEALLDAIMKYRDEWHQVVQQKKQAENQKKKEQDVLTPFLESNAAEDILEKNSVETE